MADVIDSTDEKSEAADRYGNPGHRYFVSGTETILNNQIPVTPTFTYTSAGPRRGAGTHPRRSSAGAAFDVFGLSPRYAPSARSRRPRQLHAVVGERERRTWLALMIVGISWGILSGWSLAASHFWLEPTTAILGCVAVAVLVATLWKWTRT
jgi:hypothetical protein